MTGMWRSTMRRVKRCGLIPTGVLRRLRAYDLNGDGNGEILLGGDDGRLIMLDAATGKERFKPAWVRTITEIREAEINGEPSSREFVVGGKDGGVWAFTADRRANCGATTSTTK